MRQLVAYITQKEINPSPTSKTSLNPPEKNDSSLSKFVLLVLGLQAVNSI